jgi:hypothetical protein
VLPECDSSARVPARPPGSRLPASRAAAGSSGHGRQPRLGARWRPAGAGRVPPPSSQSIPRRAMWCIDEMPTS